MKLHHSTASPSLKVFLQYFLLMLGLYTVMAGAFYLLFATDKPLPVFFESVAILFFSVPLLNALTFMFAARKHQLILTEAGDLPCAARWAVDVLQQNGLRVQANGSHYVVLEPESKYNRVFRNWFGTELITVWRTNEAVTAEGHAKYIDILDTKIKFGKPSAKFN